MNLIVDVVGWSGAVVVLVAYALVSNRRVEGDSWQYQTLNIAGAALLLVNTAFKGAYPSSFVNGIWIGIAVLSIWRGQQKSKSP